MTDDSADFLARSLPIDAADVFSKRVGVMRSGTPVPQSASGVIQKAAGAADVKFDVADRYMLFDTRSAIGFIGRAKPGVEQTFHRFSIKLARTARGFVTFVAISAAAGGAIATHVVGLARLCDGVQTRRRTARARIARAGKRGHSASDRRFRQISELAESGEVSAPAATVGLRRSGGASAGLDGAGGVRGHDAARIFSGHRLSARRKGKETDAFAGA